MWCEITERKAKGGRLYIRLEDDEGREVRPNHLFHPLGSFMKVHRTDRTL